MPRGRPRKKPLAQVQGSVPVEREEVAVAERTGFDFRSVTKPMLYWHGVLPAIGTFKVKRSSKGPTDNVSGTTGEYFSYEGVTSKSLWLNPANDEEGPQWMGKCRWYQQLDVSSLHFPAFTDEITRQVGSVQGNRRPYPGAVSLLDAVNVAKVIQEMDRFVIRINEGHIQVPESEWHTVNNRNVRVVDLRHGHIPDGMSPEEYRDIMLRGQAVSERESRRQYDIPISEFIYLIPLEDADTNMRPDNYVSLVPSFHSFFDNPPPALSELLK